MKLAKAAIALVILSTAVSVRADDNSETKSKTTMNGTSVTTTTSSSDKTGILGTRKIKADEKTEVDPKGLNNKVTTTAHEERKIKANGDVNETAEAVHADGTAEKHQMAKVTKEHWTDNGHTTTTTHTDTLDPKGLGNKTTVTTKTKIDQSPDGSGSRTVTKEINGTKVSEETVSRTK